MLQSSLIRQRFKIYALDLQPPLPRDVAQPGSALAWGARGRKFESCRPDFKAFRPLKASLLGTGGQRKKDKQ